MSKPKYTDPVVAYNTGYNDGAREERARIIKAETESKAPCPLCNGTKQVCWGVPHRLGGAMGPCLCTPEGKRHFGR